MSWCFAMPIRKRKRKNGITLESIVMGSNSCLNVYWTSIYIMFFGITYYCGSGGLNLNIIYIVCITRYFGRTWSTIEEWLVKGTIRATFWWYDMDVSYLSAKSILNVLFGLHFLNIVRIKRRDKFVLLLCTSCSLIILDLNLIYLIWRPDISNRARYLLSRWSKIFARSQAMKKPNAVKSSTDAQDEMLLKQR